jgi:hypothetical protein
MRRKGAQHVRARHQMGRERDDVGFGDADLSALPRSQVSPFCSIGSMSDDTCDFCRREHGLELHETVFVEGAILLGRRISQTVWRGHRPDRNRGSRDAA